jgi:multidrug efflux system membrane fusion protein
MKQSFSNSRSFACRAGFVASAFALGTMVVFSGCSRSDKSGAKKGAGGGGPPVPVLVAKAVETNVPVQISAIGNVTPRSTVTIRSQISGKLQDVHFKEGQTVKKGDLLFTIDPRPAQVALDQVKANLARDAAQLENAKIQFDREKKLFDSKLVSQEEFDNARAAMDVQQGTAQADQAAITNAMLNLAYTTISSPMDGLAGSQLVFVGNIIKSPDDAMVTINQMRPIYVTFAVAERYLPEIRRENAKQPLKVETSFAGMTNTVPEGELTFVDNSVDTTTGTIQLKGTFANEDNVLWPGQFVQVMLTLAELPKAVVVPSQAVQTGPEGQYVYVVDQNQAVDQRPITIGVGYKGMTVVESRLKVGEMVVTEGHLRIAPKMKVSFKAAGQAEGSKADESR